MSKNHNKVESLSYLDYVDLEERIIYINREIDPDVWVEFCKGLDHLERLSPKEEVTIKINCTGGDIHSGLGIIDHFRRKSNINIVTLCEGTAESMAAWILVCGDERLITKNSYVVLHNGQYSFSSEDYSAQEQERKFHKDIEKRMWKMMAEYTNRSAKWWENKCKTGNFILNSTQAKKQGIVTRII